MECSYLISDIRPSLLCAYKLKLYLNSVCAKPPFVSFPLSTFLHLYFSKKAI